MVELAEELSAAAWKIRNLEDYDGRLERAVQRFDEISRERPEPALMVYATALKKSGRSEDEIRGMVREFHETFEDEEEPLTIPRASAIMSVEGDGWFFGDENLRVLTGRLLGQFQHRVAQYNYVDEREVLRRWADGYDTRLFVRRRIHEATRGTRTRPSPTRRGSPCTSSFPLPSSVRCSRTSAVKVSPTFPNRRLRLPSLRRKMKRSSLRREAPWRM
jgi:hypothetical protein